MKTASKVFTIRTNTKTNIARCPWAHGRDTHPRVLNVRVRVCDMRLGFLGHGGWASSTQVSTRRPAVPAAPHPRQDLVPAHLDLCQTTGVGFHVTVVLFALSFDSCSWAPLFERSGDGFLLWTPCSYPLLIFYFPCLLLVLQRIPPLFVAYLVSFLWYLSWKESLYF